MERTSNFGAFACWFEYADSTAAFEALACPHSALAGSPRSACRIRRYEPGRYRTESGPARVRTRVLTGSCRRSDFPYRYGKMAPVILRTQLMWPNGSMQSEKKPCRKHKSSDCADAGTRCSCQTLSPPSTSSEVDVVSALFNKKCDRAGTRISAPTMFHRNMNVRSSPMSA